MNDLYETIPKKMADQFEIGKRIKELRKQKKFSQTFVAKKLYISQAAYSLIENSQNRILVEHIISLSNIYEVTTDYLLKGDDSLVRMSQDNGFVPFIKVQAHAGYIKNIDNGISLEDHEWYRIPGFNPSIGQKLFEVEGESMIPTILPGDILICQEQHKIENAVDGSLVVLVSTNRLMVKRLRIDDNPDLFVLENDNPTQEHEKERIPKTRIKELLMVRGKISSSLVPHHQLASKGKISAMEESIEILKKELYSVNKKINALMRN